MKRVRDPGELLLYKGNLARVVGIGEGRTITIELLDSEPCATCGAPPRVSLLEHAPLFQDNVEPVRTLRESTTELYGVIVDSGGGEVRVLVDRSTHSYPTAGTPTRVVWPAS